MNILTSFLITYVLATLINASTFPVDKIWKLKQGIGDASKYNSIRFYLDSSYQLYLNLNKISQNPADLTGQKLEIFNTPEFLTDSIIRYREVFDKTTQYKRTVYITLLKTSEVRLNYLEYYEEGLNFDTPAGDKMFFTTVYCCQNADHSPSHCAENAEEMKQLSKKNGCKKWK